MFRSSRVKWLRKKNAGRLVIWNIEMRLKQFPLKPMPPILLWLNYDMRVPRVLPWGLKPGAFWLQIPLDRDDAAAADNDDGAGCKESMQWRLWEVASSTTGLPSISQLLRWWSWSWSTWWWPCWEWWWWRWRQPECQPSDDDYHDDEIAMIVIMKRVVPI